MNSINFAVEFDHDENILEHCGPASYLSECLASLILDDESSERLRQKLLLYKAEADFLESNFDPADYYVQKEELIFKIVCEVKGIDYDQCLKNEP
ncbi:GL19128 [Drosophila persimilis]|uniref:GL19128 n=1 Tax=Drosophila persimilis TaxID=7234 RepID=B4G6Y1_DROPE|nr:uncharacterized protein LOC6604624 [Drosophila persimilis]EDW25278.1 GL22873 [Drosophila persimilis]EDW28300.1 GL19128 [Drosophila persimilis]